MQLQGIMVKAPQALRKKYNDLNMVMSSHPVHIQAFWHLSASMKTTWCCLFWSHIAVAHCEMSFLQTNFDAKCGGNLSFCSY